MSYSPDDYDMGYTPARPVVRSLSDIFHHPWGGRQSGTKTVAVRTKRAYPQSVDADHLLQQLTNIVTDCAEKHNCETVDGMNHTWRCPNRERCNRFWNRVTNKTCLRRLAPEMYEQFKVEFTERIKPK